MLEDAQEERFTSWDGTEIVYRQWGVGWFGPPVVLHHGFVADAFVNWVFPGIVDALVGAGRHVVALDARGHGRSGKPYDPASYGEAVMAVDLRALVDRLDAEEVDLVGYSMGAIVALIAATQDPRVRRLVVGGVGAGVIEVGGVDTRVISNHVMRAALEADDPGRIDDPGAAAFRAFADAVDGDRRALAAQAASVHAAPIPLEQITAPTLVLAGDVDPLAVRPQVLAEAIPGACVQLLSGDHFGAVTDPDCAQAIVDFLGNGISMLPRGEDFPEDVLADGAFLADEHDDDEQHHDDEKPHEPDWREGYVRDAGEPHDPDGRDEQHHDVEKPHDPDGRDGHVHDVEKPHEPDWREGYVRDAGEREHDDDRHHDGCVQRDGAVARDDVADVRSRDGL